MDGDNYKNIIESLASLLKRGNVIFKDESAKDYDTRVRVIFIPPHHKQQPFSVSEDNLSEAIIKAHTQAKIKGFI